MSFKETQISTIDLGLPLEAQVLSQFFDPEFIPSDYINALFMTSLNSNNQSNSINNKSNELYSASSLNILFKRCSSLSLHFNEYTNELAKRFDQSYEKLYSSSTQIISYDNNSSNDKFLADENEDKESNDIVTRLQYHLATLNTSMYTLLEDLKNTRVRLNDIDPTKRDTKEIENLQTLVLIRTRIEEVKSSFNLLKSLIASSEIEDSKGELNNSKTFKNDKITVSEFKNALSVLHNLMQDQISQEIELFNTSKKNGTPIEINKKLIKIIDNMINLQPIFKSFINFQTSYAVFVEFLKDQKSNYLDLFDENE